MAKRKPDKKRVRAVALVFVPPAEVGEAVARYRAQQATAKAAARRKGK